MKILSNGARLYLEQYGEGEPVVFSHGWLDDCSIWSRQIGPLAREYRLILYDHRGHGKSDKPAGNYSIETLSNDLYSVIHELNPGKVNLVGFSMGGEAALLFTLKHPDMVSKLVLVGTTAKMAWQSHAFQFISHVLPYRVLLVMLSRAKYNKPSTEVINTSLSMALQVPKNIAYRCLREINKYDVRNIASQIHVPTLIITGELDRLNFRGSQYLNRQIKGSKLQIIANSGHTVMIERPDDFTKLIREYVSRG